MNIGIVCYPTFWGSGIVATELWTELAQKWHKVHFITYDQPIRLNIFTKNIFYHEVSVSDYPLFEYQPYESALTSKLVDITKYEKLDIIHVHYAIPHATAAYMAQQILKEEGIHIPFITTLHGTDITLLGKDESFEPVISFSINKSSAVTAVSQYLKESTHQHFHIDQNIQVIPNFIDIQSYKEQNVYVKEESEQCPIITHMSNFRKVKRVEDVIKVFALVRKQQKAKLFLIGDWPERNKIEQLCRQLKLCDDIKFFGKIKEPEKILQVADIFIMPSETESFGLAALEAMAAKTPVISTNIGWIAEVNKHNFSGFLSNVWDIEDMAKNTLYILQDQDTITKFKKQAYQQAQKFSKEKIIPLYEELYKKTIENHH